MNSNETDHLNPSIIEEKLKIVEKIKIKYAILSVNVKSPNELKKIYRTIFNIRK
tara:strand:- start:35 stop:196 length:162 start_codon:yes stop_codon:yes gene_type:complete